MTNEYNLPLTDTLLTLIIKVYNATIQYSWSIHSNF